MCACNNLRDWRCVYAVCLLCVCGLVPEAGLICHGVRTCVTQLVHVCPCVGYFAFAFTFSRLLRAPLLAYVHRAACISAQSGCCFGQQSWQLTMFLNSAVVSVLLEGQALLLTLLVTL
jgi:hypothetical protein